MLSIEIGVVM